MNDAELEGSELEDAELEDAELEHFEPEDAELECFEPEDTELENVEPEGPELEDTELEDTELEDAELENLESDDPVAWATTVLSECDDWPRWFVDSIDYLKDISEAKTWVTLLANFVKLERRLGFAGTVSNSTDCVC